MLDLRKTKPQMIRELKSDLKWLQAKYARLLGKVSRTQSSIALTKRRLMKLKGGDASCLKTSGCNAAMIVLSAVAALLFTGCDFIKGINNEGNSVKLHATPSPHR